MMRIRLPALVIRVVSILLLYFACASNVFAQSGGMGNLTDVVNTMSAGKEAEHSISFSLPQNAAAVRTSDWIIISMRTYSNVQAPTALSGTYAGGTPQFSVSGTSARVTNITLMPGAQLTISGIKATFPMVPDQFQIAVVIAEDEAGTIIKNIGMASPTTTVGKIDITASIVTPEARLVLSGFAAPETFVTFTEYGSVTGTDISGLDGHFGHTFSGILPGDHQVTFFGIDKQKRTTTPITLDLYTPAYQETTVSNQVLSPTISIAKSVYSLGEPIDATGTAVPNSTITLFTESPMRAYSTTTNGNGDWTYTITDTNAYYLGDYHIHAIVQTASALTSLNSPSIGFSFISSQAPTGTACGIISRGDLNCDNKIDLTDFSILMYYWGTNNAVADTNNDGIVDLTDFSVMMYYWGT